MHLKCVFFLAKGKFWLAERLWGRNNPNLD
jgi:hypothetical protein